MPQMVFKRYEIKYFVTDEQRATIDKLVGLLEDDEDVTSVYTTMKPSEEE